MREVARYLVGIFGGLVLTAGSAAADNSMVVVVDATGSMFASSTHCDGVTATTRFETAKCWAEELVSTRNTEDGLTGGVQVYTFHNNFFTGEMGLIDESSGFVTAGTALGIISGLSAPTGTTPLAGSMCDAIDVASASGATDQRFLAVFTDGGENDTDMTHTCYGPDSTIPDDGPPFQTDSWQNKVWLHADMATPSVTIDAALLYNDVTTFSSQPLTDLEFFGYLAAGTGGTFTPIGDNSGPPPQVPVFGDLDGDFDVDRDDAIQLALLFGTQGPPPLAFDGDPVIGYADYEILLAAFGTGHNPPEADPYTQRDVIRCGNRDQIVIDGEVIEHDRVAINTRNRCDVVIRDSLIVAGDAAFRVRGTGRFIIDDSIVVGEAAWLSSRGVTTVSAANSIFIGGEDVTGSFQFEDRGGNAFQMPGADGPEPTPNTADSYADDGLGVGCSAATGASGSSLAFVLLAALIAVRRRLRE